MANYERDLSSEHRKLLENPYAYIEQLVAPEQGPITRSYTIAASRKLLENPYTYLAGNGGYDADETRSGQPTKRSRWTDQQIEVKVREFHSRLWREREEALWAATFPRTPSIYWTLPSHYAWSDSTSKLKSV